jgi:hypothetical protein
MVHLSEQHSIELAEEYRHLLKRPQQKDYVLHTIYVKTVNEMPLKQAELVIAGNETLESVPRARHYPVHFRKTYYPQSFFTDPRVEFDTTQKAADLLGMPEPVGYSRTVFRNSFIPGRTFDRVSPFGASPEDRNIAIGRDAPVAQLAGIWRLLEEIFAQITTLHENRFSHGDMQLHNILVCPSPLRAFLIDFEVSVADFDGPDEDWEKKVYTDLEEILREAIYVQTALGCQQGPLAERSLELLPRLFRNPKPFENRLTEVGLHT